MHNRRQVETIYQIYKISRVPRASRRTKQEREPHFCDSLKKIGGDPAIKCKPLRGNPPQAAIIYKIYKISRAPRASRGTMSRRTKQEREPHFCDSLYKNWRRPTFPQTSAVSSAMRGLTSLFGMGRGEHPLHSHQK